MSGSDAMHSEMPGFLFPGRPGGENDEPLLDMIFDGRSLPPRAPQEMHDLARMLAVAAGPAEELSELAGETAALAAFTRSASPASVLSAARTPTGQRRPRRHRAQRRWARSRARLATALIAAVAALSGAAVYTGVLQQVAHVTVRAVSSGAHVSPTPKSNSQPRHRNNHPTQQPPSTSAGHAREKENAAGTSPTPTPRNRPRVIGCTPWPVQSSQPWPKTAASGQPRLNPCPAVTTPVPTSSMATRSPAIPGTGVMPSAKSSPTPLP
jgi:hypothetical protein